MLWVIMLYQIWNDMGDNGAANRGDNEAARK